MKALKHFQDAFKLNSGLVDALAEAREVYWELGKLNMVQKLLELQIKGSDAATAGPLFCQLGDVLCDLGDDARATEAYARAVQTAQGKPTPGAELLHDVQVCSGESQERIDALLAERQATRARRRSGPSLFVRAARIARRFAPEEVEGLLAQAYAILPTNLDGRIALRGFARARRSDGSRFSPRRKVDPREAFGCGRASARGVRFRHPLGVAPSEPRSRRRVRGRSAQGVADERGPLSPIFGRSTERGTPTGRAWSRSQSGSRTLPEHAREAAFVLSRPAGSSPGVSSEI